MLPPPDAALAHYSDRQSLVSAGAEVAAQMWAEVNPASIVESWTMQVPELTAVLSGAQLGAARQADPYLDEVAAWQEVDTATASLVDAKSFAGIASDGRSLMSLLMSPAFSALQVIGSGLASRQALSLGGQHLDTIARTQVADAGRLADGVSLAAHKGLDGYVRVVVGKTCSRCITLAGKKYRWNAGFQRHPHCDCVHLPCQLAEAGGLVQNPAKIYRSMTDRERTAAGWSRADQQALADGADIGQVTNAHRGVYIAGGRKFTTEGATKRGLAGSRLGKRTARLTPEQIYLEAGADRDAALRLLYDHGYLLNKPAMVSRRSLALAADAPAPMPVTAAASFDRRLSRAATENAAWEATPRVLGDEYSPLARRSGVDDWSESERRAAFEAVQGYKVNDYRGVNDRLRGRELRGMSAEEADRAIAAMDDAFRHSQLQQDVVVWRGVGTGRDVFGDAVDGDLTGVEWTDAAYMSTSALHDSAEHYARPRTRGGPPGVLFRIVVPPKVGAIGAEAVSDYRTLASASEAEVLLQRGLKLRVVRDRGLVAATDEAYAGPRSVRMLDVEVAPVPTKAAAVKKAAAMAGADLSKMTVTQLREVAKERGIKVPSRALKADIQALLRASKAPVVSDLSKLTIPKLRELAKERGVAIPSKALKADIVKLLGGAAPPAAAKKAATVAVKKAAPAKKAAAPVQPKPLTIVQLKQLAKANGVYLPAGLGRPDIIEHIQAWERLNKRRILPVTAPAAAARKGTKALQEHISRIVDAPAGEMDEAYRVLDAQAALTPKTMLRLEGVQLPGMGSAEARRYAADVANSNGVYNFSGRPILRLNPHWGAEGYNARYRAAIIERKLKGHQSGWSTPTGLPPGVGATLAHEYGHHVSRMIITPTGDSRALGSYVMREPAASRLLPVLNDALGATQRSTFTRNGKLFDLFEPHRSGALDNLGPPEVGEHLFDAWMIQNKALLEQKVSKYGSSDFLELLAEIWQEYSTMGAKARPHIQKIGRVMHELAEEMA